MGDFVDVVKMNASGPDGSFLILGSALTGALTLAQVIGSGAMAIGDSYVQFYVEDALGNWEVSSHTITSATTLSRNAVLSSSNGRQPAVFPNGVATVQMIERGKSFNKTTTSTTVVAASAYTPPVSQYDRALVFPPPPRQTNAVKDLSRNINDLQYVGLISDAEVYDTEAGALSVGMSTSKALCFHWGKMSWDLGAGESLLIQMRVKTVGATGTSSTHLFGNYNGSNAGLDVILYDPANASFPGYLIINYKAQGAAAQSLQVPAAVVGASTVTANQIPTDIYVNITIHVDGAMRLMYVYTNGQPHINAGVTQLNAGSSLQTAGQRRNFGLGHIPTDDSFSTTLAKARCPALRPQLRRPT